MIRDITIGQYYPADSVIHRLDPRVKIVCTLLFLISLFVQNSLLGYAIATVFLFWVIHASKVPLKFILRGLKAIVIILMFTVVMNLFLTTGGKELVHIGFLHIYEKRAADVRVYGGPLDLSDHGIVADDLYDNAERVDGRNRETAASAEQTACPGA